VFKGQAKHPEAQLEAMANPVRLTGREQALVSAVVDGCANRAIARRFGVSEQTVKNQLSVLFQKVGVSSRLELAMYAVRHWFAERETGGRKNK
jgi:DNA-binding NarL/FixJ family response regulator